MRDAVHTIYAANGILGKTKKTIQTNQTCSPKKVPPPADDPLEGGLGESGTSF